MFYTFQSSDFRAPVCTHEKSFLSPPAEVTCEYVRGGGQGHQLSGADVIKALLLFQPTLARIVNAAGGELVRDLNCEESLEVDGELG